MLLRPLRKYTCSRPNASSVLRCKASGIAAAKAGRQARAFALPLEGHSQHAVAAIMTAAGEAVSHETTRKLIDLEAAEHVDLVAEQYAPS